MLDDLIVELDPPPNRLAKCNGAKERHLTDASVMLAFAMHLLRTVPNLTTVEIHPAAEHGKRFDILRWLSARGFKLKKGRGIATYCGTYTREKQTIIVTSMPGMGDVVAKSEGASVVAECKGGIVNTQHPGQLASLRNGLCEAVGLLLASPRAGRQVAVAPYTEGTLRLAQKLAPRAKDAGIEIALVHDLGDVVDVVP